MYLKQLLVFILLLLTIQISQAQVEKPIRLSNCQQNTSQEIENCFLTTLKQVFNSEFNIANRINQKDFSVVFLASKTGEFEVLYVNTESDLIKKEVSRVFKTFPKFTPAQYNNHAIDKRFILPYLFNNKKIEIETKKKNEAPKKNKLIYKNRLYNSVLNIPLTHQNYRGLSNFEFSENAHTAVKPYIYNEVAQQVDFDSLDQKKVKKGNSWFSRKLWNENMLAVQGDNYWFHLDPVIDLSMGIENDVADYTYNNTRGIKIEGGLANKIGFTSSIFESQGRFADYFNSWALSRRPINEAYAIIPSRDTSKEFKNGAFDYPMATGSVSVAPYSFMTIQFGHDKNFIGDGYRSLFLSDVGAPYTFLKINTKFWNIQYTNIWTWLRDVNTETASDEPYKRKYMALHYLSWNATKSLNIGLFESVTWAKTENSSFDVQYLNPVILYRAMEYANGSKAGNAMLGLSANYRFKGTAQFYSQFVLDELTMSEFFKGSGYWANKYGFQVGAKYYDAFKIPNLMLQAEYNQVQAFTYSHNNPTLNYGHANQALAHLWESNFQEFTMIASYQRDRWFGSAKIISGAKGFDINSDTDTYSYGGDIFRNNTERNNNYGITIGQGNKATIRIGELQAGYLINPATNLKIFGSVLYRDFKTQTPNAIFENKTTTWFNLGIRTDINNWYFDF
ncbi:MAG TPA: gliding motility protein RemB [Lutibacter sp.]|nr:gliding motility protein RemB [Lutibacter sp.]